MIIPKAPHNMKSLINVVSVTIKNEPSRGCPSGNILHQLPITSIPAIKPDRLPTTLKSIILDFLKESSPSPTTSITNSVISDEVLEEDKLALFQRRFDLGFQTLCLFQIAHELFFDNFDETNRHKGFSILVHAAGEVSVCSGS